ncbi:hypothetical protein XENOCAPTIV_030699 [Xenoophorus captivus]|uniref:Ig-like domain-containing protein n=1 Tax=Xenoophorus captivus TaxID=1517983 RepID=A0ABV0SDF6_9TELE
MAVMVKVGVPVLILMVLLGAAQEQLKYFEIGGKLVLRPGFSGPITSITWKHKGNLVAEWIKDKVPLEYLGDLKGQSELDLTTGTLTVSNMLKAHDGSFTVEINEKVLPGSFNAVGVRNLNQTKVEVIMRPLTCSSDASSCTLDCGEDFRDAETVQYFWKNGEAGKWESGEKRKVINKDEKIVNFKSFTCKAKNPISEKESDPLENPFLSKSGGSNTNVVVGVVVAILLIVLAVVGWFIYQWFINKRANFCPASADRNGSPGLPADGKSPETTEMLLSRFSHVACLVEVYMACQSMLIVLVGYTPEYQIEQQGDGPSSHRELQQHVTFTEDVDSIVTEVREPNICTGSHIRMQNLKTLTGSHPSLCFRLFLPPGLFFEVIFGYVTAVAPSYEVFAASRLLVGLMNGGIGLVCFVLTQEYVGKSYWAMTGTKAADPLTADVFPCF